SVRARAPGASANRSSGQRAPGAPGYASRPFQFTSSPTCEPPPDFLVSVFPPRGMGKQRQFSAPQPPRRPQPSPPPRRAARAAYGLRPRGAPHAVELVAPAVREEGPPPRRAPPPPNPAADRSARGPQHAVHDQLDQHGPGQRQF